MDTFMQQHAKQAFALSVVQSDSMCTLNYSRQRHSNKVCHTPFGNQLSPE